MYRNRPALAALGDWLFPDAHLSLKTSAQVRDGANSPVTRHVEQFMALASETATLAQRIQKPLALKQIMYPWDGADEASPESQRYFIAEVLDCLGSPEAGLNLPVAYVVHSAYDAPWKRGGPFHPWDPYTGLLDSNGTPRPAVGEIVRRKWYPT